MVHSHNGILGSSEEPWGSDTSYRMEVHPKHRGEGKKPDTKGHTICDALCTERLEQVTP